LKCFVDENGFFLVFEFVDHTLLDELEKHPNGLSEITVQKILWQVLKAVEFIHSHNIIHRDIKPENILNSRNGVVKLCDFGFARTLAASGEVYTDYVATRWYRAPELLVGDTKYGKAVDIWAIGCLVIEMLTADPLFPGDSDIDQLFQIIKCFGNLCPRHREIFYRNPLFTGIRLPDVKEVEPFEKRFFRLSIQMIKLLKRCMSLDPNDRSSASNLLLDEFFLKYNFKEKGLPDLQTQIEKEKIHKIFTKKFDKKNDEKIKRNKLVLRQQPPNKEVSKKNQLLNDSRSKIIKKPTSDISIDNKKSDGVLQTSSKTSLDENHKKLHFANLTSNQNSDKIGDFPKPHHHLYHKPTSNQSIKSRNALKSQSQFTNQSQEESSLRHNDRRSLLPLLVPSYYDKNTNRLRHEIDQSEASYDSIYRQRQISQPSKTSSKKSIKMSSYIQSQKIYNRKNSKSNEKKLRQIPNKVIPPIINQSGLTTPENLNNSALSKKTSRSSIASNTTLRESTSRNSLFQTTRRNEILFATKPVEINNDKHVTYQPRELQSRDFNFQGLKSF